MDELVHLNEAHQILICQLCQAGVRPGVGIERHFRKEHRLKGQVLQDIKDYFSTIELNDPVTVQIPTDGTAAIEKLKITKGYSCTSYWYLTIARDNITRHQRLAAHPDSDQPYASRKITKTDVFIYLNPVKAVHETKTISTDEEQLFEK